MRYLGTCVILVLAALPLGGTTFTVTNTNDSGAGSLRQALLDAQNCAGAPHSIEFNVPVGSLTNGVALLAPASALPAISCAGTTVDGTTQTTNQGDTNPLALGSGGTVGTGPDGRPNTGDEATLAQLGGPEVEIDGSALSGAILTIQAGAATVRGLSLHGGGDFSGNGVGSGNIDVQSGAGSIIEENVIGATATAYANPGGAAQTQNNLIRVTGGSNLTIQNNLLGFTRWRSILLFSTTIDTVTIEGNEFNGSFDGIDFANPGLGPGGTVAVSKNLFHDFVDNGSGSSSFAVYATQTDGSTEISENTVQGIDYPLVIDVARPVVVERNILTGGKADGVRLYVASTKMPTTIRRNSIFDNGELGIDLDPDGVTPNDPGDGDTGPNELQNFPVVSSVMPAAPVGNGAVGTRIQGVLHSSASTTYDLDFYANDPCSPRPQDFLEGKTYIGSSQVTTDGSGNAPFDVTLPVSIAAGSPVSATATDPLGNTSEFSQRLPFSVAPTSGPSAGGTSIAVSGTDFANGATVSIGGVPATNVDVSSSTMLSATTPALAPGTVNNLTVTNTDGSAGTLPRGFVSDFLDVPFGQQFYSFVTTLVRNAITAGIGNGLYGVNDSTLRQQMAVFLLKAKYGVCYVPPPCTGIFTDVPCPSTFANWIEALSAEGITGGCGGTNYCPQNPVRRDQMAVFLLKTEHGSSYTPPMCSGVFPDVPCPSTFANWIEQLAAEAITGGCGGGNYCPLSPNTRGQMAVFISKTFNLQ